MKSKKATTYLPPDLVARMDALLREEGGTRSGLLRRALWTCLTDLEWARATRFRRKDAVEYWGLDAATVERQIAQLRAQHGPAPLSLHPRLKLLVKAAAKEVASPAAGEKAVPAAGKRVALTTSLDPELAVWAADLAAREEVTHSALLRGTLERYLARREWDAMLLANQKWAKERGLTEEDVIQAVKEVRAEMRAERLK